MSTFIRQVFQRANCRYFATKAKRKETEKKPGPQIDSVTQSLGARGFLRSQKAYDPPVDLKPQLEAIYGQVLGTTDRSTRLTDTNKRFALLCACEEKLQHKIPNSLLHTLETLDDVTKYYETPVKTITPLDQMRNLELPKNLHVQYDYHRFHPDTDTKFGGVTAFPGSSTLVTGLKYKDKYKGHRQKIPYPEL